MTKIGRRAVKIMFGQPIARYQKNVPSQTGEAQPDRRKGRSIKNRRELEALFREDLSAYCPSTRP